MSFSNNVHHIWQKEKKTLRNEGTQKNHIPILRSGDLVVKAKQKLGQHEE